MSKDLWPFAKLPNPSEVNILIVGSEGVAKHQLGKILVQQPNELFTTHVRTALSLPLPSGNSDLRPRIDLVVFMVDCSTRKSMEAAQESVNKLDIQYFLGRVCFVATKVDEIDEHGGGLEFVMQLARKYQSPFFAADLQTESGRSIIAQQLLQLVTVSAGFNLSVSPLVIGSTRMLEQNAGAL